MGLHEHIVAAEPARAIEALRSPAAEALFDPTEAAVLKLAELDGPDMLRVRTRQSLKVRDFLFGGYNYALADPRLETLRRLCILLRAGMAPAAGEEAGRALLAGFSPAQLAWLEERYGNEAGKRPARPSARRRRQH